jgi:hypothetical protein
MLHFIFAIIPVAAGIDKFSGRLADWDKYLAPAVSSNLNMPPHLILQYVGAIEIAIGLIVLFRPRIGAYLLALWLAGIILNLIVSPAHYWDVAAGDLGLLVGALSLGSISAWADRMRQLQSRRS